MRIRAVADADGAEHEPGWAYPVMVLRWSARYYEDERDRADAMLQDLEQVASKRGSTSPTRAQEARRSSQELRTHSI